MLLKEAMEDLAYNVTAEEQKALSEPPTASAEWQRKMALSLAAQQRNEVSGNAALKKAKQSEIPKEDQQPEVSRKDPQLNPKPAFSWWHKLAWPTVLPAVAIIAIAVGWLVWLNTREPDVNALLAQAYTEQRTIKLRLPGAKYAQMSVQRGKEHSSLNRPTSLLDAESIIGHRLDKNSKDPEWLNKKGRAELLDGNYDSAIATLR